MTRGSFQACEDVKSSELDRKDGDKRQSIHWMETSCLKIAVNHIKTMETERERAGLKHRKPNQCIMYKNQICFHLCIYKRIMKLWLVKTQLCFGRGEKQSKKFS